MSLSELVILSSASCAHYLYLSIFFVEQNQTSTLMMSLHTAGDGPVVECDKEEEEEED